MMGGREGKRASLESGASSESTNSVRETVRHVGRACACSKNTRVGVYKLLEDLRSQFEPCESSHRCRVGYSYSDVYPPVHHLPCTQYSPLTVRSGGFLIWDGERCLEARCAMQLLVVGRDAKRAGDKMYVDGCRGESDCAQGLYGLP